MNQVRKQGFKQLWNGNRFGVGNLYTWGMHSLGCGFDSETRQDQLVPRRLEQFRNNVRKVEMGYHTSAVITDQGDLFMFGRNNKGQLGLGHKEDRAEPERVDFFAEHGLTVTEVALGDQHTVALTSDGQVWTWGYNGICSVPFWNNVFPDAGGLGDRYNEDQLVPQPVKRLRDTPKPQQISAGHQFTTLLNEQGEVYNWGRGDDGQFGNGQNSWRTVYPQRNPVFDQVKKMGLKILKIRSARRGTTALLSDGLLYGWGHNLWGQLGIREQEYVRTDFVNPLPLPINTKYMLEGETVVDFDLGYDSLCFYTNLNRVYMSGIDLTYVPMLVYQAKQGESILRCAASDNAVAFLTSNNELYGTNTFVQPLELLGQQLIFKTDNKRLFNGGQVKDIGGNYRIRYAIVQN